MHGRLHSFLAGALAALLVLQPAVAWTCSSPPVSEPVRVDQPAEQLIKLDAGRQMIVAQLVELGRSVDEATAAALALTAEDVAVLTANERMMQAAGATNMYVLGWIGVIVLVGGIVALAIASDSGSLTLF